MKSEILAFIFLLFISVFFKIIAQKISAIKKKEGIKEKKGFNHNFYFIYQIIQCVIFLSLVVLFIFLLTQEKWVKINNSLFLLCFFSFLLMFVNMILGLIKQRGSRGR